MRKKKTAARKNNRHLKKKVYTTAVTLGLTAGAVVGVAAYQSSQEFSPSGENRDLNANQVLFPLDEGDNGLDNTAQDKRESALLDKTKNEDQLHMAEDASFLFDNSQYTPTNPTNQTALNDEVPGDQTQQENIVAVPGKTDAGQTPDTVTGGQGNTTTPDEIYDVVDDPNKADTIINNPTTDPIPGNTDVDTGNGDTGNGNTGNGSGDGHGQNGSGNGNGNSQDSSGNGKNDSDSGNSKPSGGNTDTPSRPTKRPADTAKDPKLDFNDKISDAFGDIRPFKENDTIKTDEVGTVGTSDCTYYFSANQDYWGTEQPYVGRTLDQETILYMMDVRITSSQDPSYVANVFTKDTYGKYIRVDRVSFDGGNTWISDFPVTVPETAAGQGMQVSISWRVRLKDKWRQEIVPYTVKEGRFFILKTRLADENQEIDKKDILNWDSISGGQYQQSDTIVNLLKFQEDIIGETEDGVIHQLFTGWTEDDRLLSWKYTVKSGRHILEPAEFVPVDNDYIIKFWDANENKKYAHWMTDDLKEDLQTGNTYCHLQTLTGVRGALSLWKNGSVTRQTVNVPRYVQAVDIEEETPLAVDNLYIPDTVLYINTNSDGLSVNLAYHVEEDNPNYTAPEGVLCNKEETEILGIPYRIHKMEISQKVETVQLTTNNQLKEISFAAETMEELPEMDFSCLESCRIIVPDALLYEFLRQKGKEVSAKGCSIAAASHPEVRYTVQNDIAVDEQGRAGFVIGSMGADCSVSDSIRTIAAEAFKNAQNVTRVQLEGENTIQLEKDCLRNSRVQMILCKTKEQLESLGKQLEYAGKPDVQLQLSAVSRDGYTYYTEEINGRQNTVLLRAPKDAAEFDGTIEKGEITVNKIADKAFADTDVVWVTLPEAVTDIGYQAFKDCAQLQGVLINTKEQITIGNQAFDDCGALRFVASNAKKAVMKDGYDPLITDAYEESNKDKNYYFYVLPDAEGYGENSRSVNGVSGLAAYRLQKTGGDSRILYGVDEQETPWIAVRSGITLPDTLNLPKGLMKIMNYAFAETETASGKCTVNWAQLQSLGWIERGAFADSDLAGDVVLGSQGTHMLLNSYAFSGCRNITSISVRATLDLLGEHVFQYCSSLERAEITDLSSSVGLQAGLFDGCDNLRLLQLWENEPPQLVMYTNVKYQFNIEWSLEEEAEKLDIQVPKGRENDYIKAWRYAYAGYTGASNQGGSAFLDMWNDIYMELFWEKWSFPEDKEVDDLLKQRLLVAENGLRGIFGQKPVKEPTDLYIWHQKDIYLSLASVPSYITATGLEAETLDFPEGWTLDTIEPDAFSGANHLEKVEIPDTLVSVESNAFRGSAESSSELTLDFQGKTPPELMDATKEEPFVFGVDEKKLHLDVPSGSEADYIKAWVYPLSGYANEETVLAEAKALLEKDDSGNDDTPVSGDTVDNTAAETPVQEEKAAEPVVYSEELSGADEAGENPDANTENGENAGGEDTSGDDSGDTAPSQPDDLLENQIRRKAAELLLPAENRLRAMMGMKKLDSIDDGMLCMDVPAEAETPEPEKQPEETAPAVINDALTDPTETPDTTGEQPAENPAGTDDSTKQPGDGDTSDSVAAENGTAANESSRSPETEQDEAKNSQSSVTEETARTDAAQKDAGPSTSRETEEKKSQTNSTGATPEAEAFTNSRLKEGETE